MPEEKPTVADLDLADVEWISADEGAESTGDGEEESRVEVAFLDDGTVLMRDGMEPEGPVLVFTSAEWEAFIEGVKDGEFDDLLDELDDIESEQPAE